LNYTTVTLREAIANGWLNSLVTDFDTLEDHIDTLVVRVYDGDTTLHDYIDLYDLYYEGNTVGILVNGNLTVNAPIIDFELDTVSCFLLVHGSLTCTVLGAGCAEIVIDGSVTATEAVIGFYNHGLMSIGGDVNSKLLLIDDYTITIQGSINAATFCRGWQLPAADYTDWRRILLPEVADALLDDSGYLFAGDTQLLHRLKDGEPVFKPDLGTFSSAGNPEPEVTTWEYIKPLVQKLPCQYEDYPFAIAEKQSEGLVKERFLLYNGSVVLNELDLDTEDYMGIIVVGDLHVTGSIINENTDGACSLIVLGNLRARNMCVGGQIIYVTGYIAVTEMIMGIYNHGEMYGKSYVWCPVVVTDDYRFYFEDFARVNVLDLMDDTDHDVVREKLVDELFDEEEGFLLYTTIRSGIPLLKQGAQRKSITEDDITALLNTPLFAPDLRSIAFSDDGWHITINRGEPPFEDFEGTPTTVIAIHLEDEHFFTWYPTADGSVATLTKHGDEWVEATADEAERSIPYFSEAEGLIQRKVRWNNKYIKTLDREALWKLIWMFRNKQEDHEYQATAVAIASRVLYAASYPFAYVYMKYPTESEYRGLEENPEWMTAAALLDGLILWELAQEISRREPLAQHTQELFTITQYNWSYDCAVDERYTTQPIDRAFLVELNQFLAPSGGVMLRLDVGIRPYIIVGMHRDDLDELNRLMHPLGIFPKYFSYTRPEDEAALKDIANEILAVVRANTPDELEQFHQYQEGLWMYTYNEWGDVAFWQRWIEDLQRAVTTAAGALYIFRDDESMAPMHPELEHWIDWCELYEGISHECNIEIPGED